MPRKPEVCGSQQRFNDLIAADVSWHLAQHDALPDFERLTVEGCAALWGITEAEAERHLTALGYPL